MAESKALFAFRFWRLYRYMRGRATGRWAWFYRKNPRSRRSAAMTAWKYARKGADA